MRRVLIFVFLVILLSLPVRALDFSAPEAPDAATELLPEEADSFAEGLWSVLSAGAKLAAPSLTEAARCCLRVLGAALLVALVRELLASPHPSAATVHFTKALPEKDFKGRIVGGCVHEVGIHIFDRDCHAFQPLYKLDKATARAWVEQVEQFVERGEVKCYAENAFNVILPRLQVHAFSYEHHYIDEIDNLDDYNRVAREIEPFDACNL